MSMGVGPNSLRWLREVSGLTQRALASQSGVSERTIRGLERGQVARPHQASLRALATAAELDELHTAAFLRAWAPDRVRSLAELVGSLATYEEVVAETILQSEIEENLVASWARFGIREDRICSIRSDFVIEAQHDGVDTYVIPYVDEASEPGLRIDMTTSGCRLADRHDFVSIGLSVFELELERPLRAGETAAFSLGLDLRGYSPTPVESDTERIVRLLHRRVPLTVIEATFDGPVPAQVWQVEQDARATSRKVRPVTPDRNQRVSLTLRDARPGTYGFEWRTAHAD